MRGNHERALEFAHEGREGGGLCLAERTRVPGLGGHKGHVWRSRIASGTHMATGCPPCARLEGRGGRVRADAEANAVA